MDNESTSAPSPSGFGAMANVLVPKLAIVLSSISRMTSHLFPWISPKCCGRRGVTHLFGNLQLALCKCHGGHSWAIVSSGTFDTGSDLFLLPCDCSTCVRALKTRCGREYYSKTHASKHATSKRSTGDVLELQFSINF